MGTQSDKWPGRLLTLGWAAACAIPVAAAITTVQAGWAPLIDNGLVADLTVDSVSLHPPLVGMPTSLGLESGIPLSHPGPIGFYLLALPTKVLGQPGYGLVLGSALIACSCLAGIGALMRRWGDHRLEALVLVAVALMMVNLGPTYFADPFNPYVGILPLLLCLLASCGVLAGHHRHLWIVVAAGSIAAQVHLGYVPLVAAIVSVTSLVLAVDVARTSGQARRRLTRTILPVAGLLGGLLWTAPILDQLFGTQNLGRLLRSQSETRPTAGLGHGLDVAVRMTGLPPYWLLGRAENADFANPGRVRIAVCVLAVTLVLGLLLWAVRRRDRALASMAGMSLLALATATMTSARVVDVSPSPYFLAQNALLYRLFWWPVGVIFVVTLVWGTVRVLSVTLTGASLGLGVGPVRAPALAILLIGLVALTVSSHEGPNQALDSYYRRELGNAKAIADLPGSPHVVLLRFQPEGRAPRDAGPMVTSDVWNLGPSSVFAYLSGLVAQLRLRGIEVRFANERVGRSTFMLGYRRDHRARGDEKVDLLYYVGPAAQRPPPPGYRLLSTAGAKTGEAVNVFNVPSAVFIRTP